MHSCYRSWPRREPGKRLFHNRGLGPNFRPSRMCNASGGPEKTAAKLPDINLHPLLNNPAEDHARGRRREQFFLSKGLPYTHESFDFVCPWMLLFWKTQNVQIWKIEKNCSASVLEDQPEGKGHFVTSA